MAHASTHMAADARAPPDDAWYMAVRRCMEAVSHNSERLGLQFLGSMAPRPAPSGEAEQGGFHAVAGHAGLLHRHVLSYMRENRRAGAPVGGVRRPRPGSVPSALPAAATAASTAGEEAAWTPAELPEPERMAALAKHAVQIAQGVEDSMMPEVSMILHPFAAAGPVALVSARNVGPDLPALQPVTRPARQILTWSSFATLPPALTPQVLNKHYVRAAGIFADSLLGYIAAHGQLPPSALPGSTVTVPPQGY